MGLLSYLPGISQSAQFFDKRDGLQSSTIKGVAVDHNGFVWACSNKGLYRFDGYRFKPYNESNLDSSQSYRGGAFSVFADSRNRIWICMEKGVVIYNQQLHRFQYPAIDRYPAGIYIRGCCEDSDSNVYLCGNTGLFRYDEASQKVTPIFSSKGPLKTGANMFWKTIAYDASRNGIWCGTGDVGMCLWDLEKQKLLLMEDVFPALKGKVLKQPVSMVRCEGERWLWFSYSRTAKMQCVDLQTGSLRNYTNETVKAVESYDNYFLQMAGKAYSRKWIAGRRYGIFYLDNADSTVWRFGGDYGTVFGVATDEAGNAWFGTSKGLVKVNAVEAEIHRYPLVFADHESEFPRMRVRADKNLLFMATTDRGLIVFNQTTQQFSRLSPSNVPAQNNIYDFGKLTNEKYWLGTWDNVFTYSSGKVHALFPVGSEAYRFLTRQVVHTVLPDANGGYYVCTAESGFIHADGSGNLLQKPVPGSILKREMNTLVKLRDGTLLAGGEQGTSLLWLRPDLCVIKQFGMHNKLKDSLGNSRFSEIYEDANGRIWLFTYHGLQIYNRISGTFRRHTGAGCIESLAYVVAETDEHLLVSTADRLVKINKQTLKVEGSLSSGQLQVTFFSGCASLDDDGYLWVAAGKELLQINKSLLNKSPTNYNLIPASLKVFDSYHNISPDNNGISLHYNENFFTLHFTDFNNQQGSGKQFKYSLSGFDAKWYVTTIPSVSYTNVPPGKYTLNIEASLPNGQINKFSFAITVVPPWWQTWWFRLLLVIGIACVSIWIVKIYIASKLRKQKLEMEKQQALQQERVRISSEIHDDIGSELTSIRLVSEVVKQKLGNDQSAIHKEIEFISGTSSTMVDRLNQIVWALNPENDQSKSLITYSRHYLTQYFGQHNIPCNTSLPHPIPEIELSTEKRQNFFLCIKELAHNVVKHSSASAVSCSFTIQSDKLFFEMKDNGEKVVDYTGILASTSRNGLRNMARRMKAIGGNFDINYQSGTISRLELLL